jgi:hypothetical protein
MMMKMLEAGGLEPMVDNIRSADEDNPKGYYEFEPVKALPKGENSWLSKAGGKVVKVIATLLPYLPDVYIYQVIFIQRDMREILASQKKMLIHRGEDPDKVGDEIMSQIFEKHLDQVNRWIREHPNVKRIDVNYNLLIHDPLPEIDRVNDFLGNRLDASLMTRVIDASLYRQRYSDTSVRS